MLASSAEGYSELAMLQRLDVQARIAEIHAQEREQLHLSFASPEACRQ